MGANTTPITVIKIRPLKRAYPEANSLADVERISSTGPIPVRIIDAFRMRCFQKGQFNPLLEIFFSI